MSTFSVVRRHALGDKVLSSGGSKENAERLADLFRDGALPGMTYEVVENKKQAVKFICDLCGSTEHKAKRCPEFGRAT